MIFSRTNSCLVSIRLTSDLVVVEFSNERASSETKLGQSFTVNWTNEGIVDAELRM